MRRIPLICAAKAKPCASHATARLLEVASALFGGEECEAEEVQYITKAPHTTYQFPLHQDNAYGQFWEP